MRLSYPSANVCLYGRDNSAVCNHTAAESDRGVRRLSGLHYHAMAEICFPALRFSNAGRVTNFQDPDFLPDILRDLTKQKF
jgi:hypothetical protein